MTDTQVTSDKRGPPHGPRREGSLPRAAIDFGAFASRNVASDPPGPRCKSESTMARRGTGRERVDCLPTGSSTRFEAINSLECPPGRGRERVDCLKGARDTPLEATNCLSNASFVCATRQFVRFGPLLTDLRQLVASKRPRGPSLEATNSLQWPPRGGASELIALKGLSEAIRGNQLPEQRVILAVSTCPHVRFGPLLPGLRKLVASKRGRRPVSRLPTRSDVLAQGIDSELIAWPAARHGFVRPCTDAGAPSRTIAAPAAAREDRSPSCTS